MPSGVAAAACSLMLSLLPMTAVAQESATPERVLSASASGVAGGAAALLSFDHWRTNPASIGGGRQMQLAITVARRPSADVAETAVAAAIPVFGHSVIAFDLHQRRVQDVVEDPELAADERMVVQDWAVAAGWTSRIAQAVSIGASIEFSSATVLGTQGSGSQGAVGIVAELPRGFNAGLTVGGLGSLYSWSTMTNERFSSKLERYVQLGAAWAQPLHRTVVAFVGDVRTAPAGSTIRWWRVGSELTLGEHVALRGGVAMDRQFGGRRTLPAAGLSLNFSRLRLAIAQEQIGHPVAERISVDIGIRR